MGDLIKFYKPAPTPKPLSEWLYVCRAEKPDEWKMDEYIRGALYLEQRIAELEEERSHYAEAANLEREGRAKAAKVFEQHIAELEQGWISVDDRLPEVGVGGVYRSADVLVIDGGDILTGCFVKIRSGRFWWRMSHIDQPLRYVTHWMPLPEPPKEQE